MENSNNVPKKIIRIKMKRSFDEFDNIKREEFLNDLSSISGIPKIDIEL